MTFGPTGVTASAAAVKAATAAGPEISVPARPQPAGPVPTAENLLEEERLQLVVEGDRLLGIDRHLGAEPGNTPLYSGCPRATNRRRVVCYRRVRNSDRMGRK